MKVVHVCNLPLPANHPDYGRVACHPGRWVLNLAIAQAAHAEIQPQLLVQVPGASKDLSTEIEGITVHFVAAPDRFRAATLFWFDVRRLASRLAAFQPDIVHAHGTEDAYGLAAQQSGRPDVITLQGTFFIINRLMKPALLSRARVIEFTERICLKRASHVVAKSEYVAVRLKEEFPHLIVHRIPNTIDPRLLEITEKKDPNVVAFVGVISPRKGLDLLCDALKLVRATQPDVTLWVFGDDCNAPSNYEVQIKERLRFALGERVVFHGTVSAWEVARHVAKAATLVAPSREEMFGNQLVEALLVGTHGIVTESTAMAENVRRFGNGTVVPQEDPKALATAIAKTLSNPVHATIVQRTRDSVATAFGPAAVALRHYQLYQQILSGG